MPVYEVWCHSCNVTFPPETRRCIHCGQPVRPERPARRGLRRASTPEWNVGEMDFRDPSAGGPPVPIEARPVTGPVASPAEVPLEESEEPVRRSLLRAGMTVLWMVLLAAGYAWRACSQQ